MSCQARVSAVLHHGLRERGEGERESDAGPPNRPGIIGMAPQSGPRPTSRIVGRSKGRKKNNKTFKIKVGAVFGAAREVKL